MTDASELINKLTQFIKDYAEQASSQRPPNEVIEDTIAFLLIDIGVEQLWNDGMDQLMKSFAKRVGLSGQESDKQTLVKIDEYFENHPVDPELIDAIHTHLHDIAV